MPPEAVSLALTGKYGKQPGVFPSGPDEWVREFDQAPQNYFSSSACSFSSSRYLVRRSRRTIGLNQSRRRCPGQGEVEIIAGSWAVKGDDRLASNDR